MTSHDLNAVKPVHLYYPVCDCYNNAPYIETYNLRNIDTCYSAQVNGRKNTGKMKNEIQKNPYLYKEPVKIQPILLWNRRVRTINISELINNEGRQKEVKEEAPT